MAKRKEDSSAVRVAVIGAIATVSVAIIAGVFAILQKQTASSPPPTGMSSTAISIISFQDFEKGNDTPSDYFRNAWFMPCDFSASTVYEGERAIQCQVQAHEKSDSQKDAGVRLRLTPLQTNL
jgi:hypothetical protein